MDVVGTGSGTGAGSSSSSGMLGADSGMGYKSKRKKRGSKDPSGKRGGKKHVLPATKQDAKISLKHHKDSIRFNVSHAKDHLDEAKKHADGLKQVKALEKRLVSLKSGKVKF